MKAVEDSEEILEHKASFTYGKETKHPSDTDQNENSKRSLDLKQPFGATFRVSGVRRARRQFVHDQRERDRVYENNKQNRRHERRKERYVSKTTTAKNESKCVNSRYQILCAGVAILKPFGALVH